MTGVQTCALPISSAVKAPLQVTVLRALAFLACAFLLATALCGTSNPFAPGAPLPPALPPGSNGSAPPDNGTAPGAEGWRQLLGLLPKHAAEKLHEAWAFGQSHQMGVVGLGLLTCLLAMLLAGRIRCVGGRRGGAQWEEGSGLEGRGSEGPLGPRCLAAPPQAPHLQSRVVII